MCIRDSSRIQDGLVNIIDEHATKHPSRDIVILGDFNDFEVRKLNEELDLTDIVTAPTRGTNTLDHILIGEGLKPWYNSTNVKYESPVGKSDHVTLMFFPEQNRKFSDTRECTVFDYRSSNITILFYRELAALIGRV